ncbi:hypothetical protein Taro_003623 [Colocasia esculenta]|uniref:Uncharacterized protein n=1 Tax=Colocasia esculenta TaxID=4460 RepID=A0A843TSC9_COLES|nr:hypothetical protein [Colocasia esculenta]
MLGRRWISPCLSSRSFSSHLLRRLHAPSLPPDLSIRSPSRRLFSTSAAGVEDAGRGSGGKIPVYRRVVHVVLLSLTGGFALSALNDLAIFHGCSSKAIERASQNWEVVEVLGEPIARGPWYDASLAVGHRRNTVSCKFPVSGPKGNAVLKIKAVRTGDDTWFSFLRHNDWDILISEALIQDAHKQTSRVIHVDTIPPSDARQKDSRSMEPGDQQKK